MNSFYMTLLSDNSMAMFPDNTQASFRTKLLKPIDITKEEWEMALVELILPSQIYNVSQEESHFFLVSHDQGLIQTLVNINPTLCRIEGDALTYPLCITPGVYSTPEHLVNEINETLQEKLGETLTKYHMNFELKYSKTAKRVKFAKNVNNKVGLRFHPDLLIKLGVRDQTDVYSMDKHSFQYDVDLYAGINHMFVYSDLADYTVVGGIEAPLLRIVPFQESNQIHVHKEFLNLHYVPVAKSYFDEIGINIRGDTGKLIQFAGGKSMIKLHLRRKPLLN